MTEQDLIEHETDRLLRHLSVDLMQEAIAESEPADLMALVQFKREGDMVNLGVAFSELLDAYARKVTEYRYGYRPAEGKS